MINKRKKIHPSLGYLTTLWPQTSASGGRPCVCFFFIYVLLFSNGDAHLHAEAQSYRFLVFANIKILWSSYFI